MTETRETAKYAVGNRLHFRPMPARAPFGTNIGECDVIVTEVVDHSSATAYAPRFSYVVRELNGSETQGTDDRELTEIPASTTIPAVTAAQRDQAHRAAYDTAHNVGTELLSDVMVQGLTAANLEELASRLTAAAGHLHIANGE